ncbi:hypothetical protein FACS189454_04890 [Planctomycetales bacterium]|nr:hypothetical protein FACS189454_04890 [Planctomycetales bacterium]
MVGGRLSILQYGKIEMKKLCYSVLLLFAASACFAQESAPTEQQTRLALEQAAQNSPVAQGLKLEKEIKGRLPSGYKAVLRPEQVKPVQEITKDYAEAIAYLTLRIELLKKEQEKKLHSLLTPEQISNIKKPVRRSTKTVKAEETPAEDQN